jgi:hypothetical protein
MATPPLFDGLTKNAVEFLRESVAQLEANPKQSLISFATAIELFLKARLLCEHWSLIYEKPDLANHTQFLKGEFKSVGMEDCIARLQKVCNVTVSTKEREVFTAIRNHRNKLVHFFHSDYQQSQATLQEVLTEEFRGWFYLMRILKSQFSTVFAAQLQEIAAIEKEMHKHKGLLAAKYQEFVADVEKGKAKGATFAECPFCSYDATIPKVLVGPLVEIFCRVCEQKSQTLKAPCPKCGKQLFMFDCGSATCSACGHKVELDFWLETFGVHQSPKEAMMDEAHAYCPECEHRPASVVPIEDIWVCLYCTTDFIETDTCGYCGTHCAGQLEDSSIVGCFMCGGPDFSDE